MPDQPNVPEYQDEIPTDLFDLYFICPRDTQDAAAPEPNVKQLGSLVSRGLRILKDRDGTNNDHTGLDPEPTEESRMRAALEYLEEHPNEDYIDLVGDVWCLQAVRTGTQGIATRVLMRSRRETGKDERP